MNTLVDMHTNECERIQRPKIAPLPPWRLRRASEYVDTHLAESITLARLASAAGLSPMHFAAQFRIATGLRPHEYLVRRRIERAQALLSSSGMALVDIALCVGFQTQAHFTTAFKRFAGETPHKWRRLNASPEATFRFLYSRRRAGAP